MSVTGAMTGIGTDSLPFHRNRRALDSAIRRLKRGHANARSEFRRRPLSRRQKTAERRKDMRLPLHVPVYLTPCILQGGYVQCVDETIMGVTRDVSDDGVGLTFDQKVSSGYVIAEFDVYGHGPIRLLVEIRWTEKKSAHAFVAGGMWQGIVDCPESELDGDCDFTDE